MKKLKQAKGFIGGFLVALLIMSGATVFANAVNRQITVTSGHINLVVNGEQVIPRDAAGNAVEPFVFEGTTFLPVRAVADIAGMDVGWDGETNTITLDRVNHFLGTWAWVDSPQWRYNFYDDGTGTRGSEEHGIENFIWWTEDYNVLRIEISNPLEGVHPYQDWGWSIMHDVLTLAGLNMDYTFRYFRVN